LLPNACSQSRKKKESRRKQQENRHADRVAGLPGVRDIKGIVRFWAMKSAKGNLLTRELSAFHPLDFIFSVPETAPSFTKNESLIFGEGISKGQ